MRDSIPDMSGILRQLGNPRGISDSNLEHCRLAPTLTLSHFPNHCSSIGMVLNPTPFGHHTISMVAGKDNDRSWLYSYLVKRIGDGHGQQLYQSYSVNNS